jgi:YihY family inner membrane protein
MDILRPVRAFDSYQQRRRWLALPMAVLRKFGNDQAGQMAALVAYYAFFSLFPLLLVMTTILGFVLQGDRHAQTAVENSVLGQFPVIGHAIGAHQLTGRISALVIGLVISLWGSLGVTGAAQTAFDRVWAVPFKDRPDFLKSRLRGLALLLSVGVLFVVSTAVSGLVSSLGGVWWKVGGIAISLAVNFAIFLAAFRFLTAAVVGTSCLWLGVAIAAGFWEILQVAGGIYINHVYRHASATYSNFALVIALLVWLHLGAQLTLYAAEINVVVTRRLWPRSLLGPPEAPADQETLAALAKVEERHDTERIEVEFEPESDSERPVRTADRDGRAESTRSARSRARPLRDTRRTPPGAARG